MTKMVAYDPGDKHVGVALFEQVKPDGPWVCIAGFETEPDEALDDLAQMLSDGDIDVVVYERWRLFSDKAPEQTGSEMETSQMIGVIRFLVRTHNRHIERHAGLKPKQRLSCACKPHQLRPVEVVGQQGPEIKKPTRALLRRRKIRPTAPATKGSHARDAELHGWCWIFHQER